MHDHTPLDWELVHAFCAVMGAQGRINAAAERLSLSPATVSRRIRDFEAGLQQTLFARTPSGLVPTAAAARIYEQARLMESAADGLSAFAQPGNEQGSTVRITAGSWLSLWIARRVDKITQTAPGARIELHASASFASLPGDEADIAIRNTRPERGRYVCKKHRASPYAVYAAKSYLDERRDARDPDSWAEQRWIGVAHDDVRLPSGRWLAEGIGRNADLGFALPVNCLDAVISGAGLGVLPCAFAEPVADIERLSEPETLGAGAIWTVVYEDVRPRKNVTDVLSALDGILKEFSRAA